VPGQAYGLGPIQACQRTLTGAQEMADYASQWITTGGVPTGVLSTDQNITKVQAFEAADMWNATNSARDGVAVLGNGLKYLPLMLKPSEVQFLESREFDSKAIARMFGIPAHLMLIGVQGSSLTYQNIQDADLSFNRWTEMAYLRPIESGLSRILNGTQTVRFNLDAFLRPDTRTRYDTYKVGIDAGFLTAEMVQEIEGITQETK
jgi:HK97 family phage portal protein